MKNQETVDKLRDEFIREAIAAPKLFSDLSKLEEYIAETYKSRSFIELIQNADDAEATHFGIHKCSFGFVVCNNGRVFDARDFEALCRSGASDKHRGGTTIGYRGIGFKSVVNLSKKIFVSSGEYDIIFDKSETLKLFTNMRSVPLIRIPHVLQNRDYELHREINAIKEEYGYNTAFAFIHPDMRIVLSEIEAFDRSSLLFLNHINQVNFQVGVIYRDIRLSREKTSGTATIAIVEGEETEYWQIYHSINEPTNSVALKIEKGVIVPAQPMESVIHSFMPTTEFSGAYIKINGDFSTDPSRRNVDLDELSQEALEDCVDILTKLIVSVFSGDIEAKGFFTPFINVSREWQSDVGKKVMSTLTSRLHNSVIKMDGRSMNFSDIRTKPEWLNYEDYEEIGKLGLGYIENSFLAMYPEVMSFLDGQGLQSLSLSDSMERINKAEVTKTGTAQITTKIIKQYRYDLDKSKIQQIKKLKLFPKKNGEIHSATEVHAVEELDTDFIQHLTDNVDTSDIRMFFKKLDLDVSSLDAHTPEEPIGEGQHSAFILEQISLPDKTKQDILFKAKPNIMKWRSAEKNAGQYLEALQGVQNVSDVSTANLGYDLEVHFSNGRKALIEVKSVSYFGEAFKITSNEYSSAHHYGHDYYVALVVNDEPFKIAFIRNPVKAVSFTKQVERWSWFCDDFADAVIDVPEFLKNLGRGE